MIIKKIWTNSIPCDENTCKYEAEYCIYLSQEETEKQSKKNPKRNYDMYPTLIFCSMHFQMFIKDNADLLFDVI